MNIEELWNNWFDYVDITNELMTKDAFTKAIAEIISSKGVFSERLERPKIKDYFDKGTTTATINEIFLKNKELYYYIKDQDNCIDELTNLLENIKQRYEWIVKTAKRYQNKKTNKEIWEERAIGLIMAAKQFQELFDNEE